MPTAGERISSIINMSIPEGDFTASVVADKVRAFLEEYEPLLIEEWAADSLKTWLHVTLNDILRKRRVEMYRRSRAAKVDQYAENFEKSGYSGIFDAVFVIDGEYTRRRLREMTAEDHEFVAQNYEQSGERSLLLASFHKQVATKVGSGRVTADVLTEEEYLRLYQSIVNE